MELPTFETIGLTLEPTEADNAVIVATIDRPGDELNRVDAALHHDFAELFAWLATLGGGPPRAVLLTGSGRAFSAGGDFAWFPQLRSPEALRHLEEEARRIVYGLFDVRLPIVCALNGPAVGLGASVALLCDAVFMGASATIVDPHVNVGLVAGDGGTISWPFLVGPMRAKRYLLTGDPVDAATAARIGLVTDTVPDAELHDTALAFASRLADGAPQAIQETKAAVNAVILNAAGPAFEAAMTAELTSFGSADHHEALDAIAERRPPRFTGE
jgi:enoyl-CoA hydratase